MDNAATPDIDPKPIRFFKLANGDNVLTEVVKTFKHRLAIANPMVILIEADFDSGQQTIYMHPWIPSGIAKGNVCNLGKKDIMLNCDVEDDIVKYYCECVLDFLETPKKEVVKAPTEYIDEEKKVVVMFKKPELKTPPVVSE